VIPPARGLRLALSVTCRQYARKATKMVSVGSTPS
jgi:hypothetical protein